MKITKIISASVLAAAVLLSASGCSNDENLDTIGTNVAIPTDAPNPTATSSESDTDLSATTEKDAVLLTINGYYYYISQPDSSDKLKAAEAAITERPASDESLKLFAEDFSEGFKYFDTSTPEKINDAYKALMIGSSAGKLNEGLKMTIPGDSVTITGDTARVNTTHIKVTLDGEKKSVAPEENPEEKDIVKLVKNDSGSWVIVAKESSLDPSSP